MSTYTQYAGATHHQAETAARCAYCAKPLPIVNGELRPWRAASGQFFCNEFCADDEEELRFQSHHRSYGKANGLVSRRA
jgi:hypothetical protein